MYPGRAHHIQSRGNSRRQLSGLYSAWTQGGGFCPVVDCGLGRRVATAGGHVGTRSTGPRENRSSAPSVFKDAGSRQGSSFHRIPAKRRGQPRPGCVSRPGTTCRHGSRGADHGGADKVQQCKQPLSPRTVRARPRFPEAPRRKGGQTERRRGILSAQQSVCNRSKERRTTLSVRDQHPPQGAIGCRGFGSGSFFSAANWIHDSGASCLTNQQGP